MALARRARPRFRLRRISVAGFALSVFSCTGFGKQASLFPCLKILARLIANAQKTPFAHLCKGRMSRGTTFSYACLSRISQGSFNVDRTGRLTVKFSLPVQKLPSIPAFLQIPLSLSGISLWRCSGMYSSFSQPFSFFAIVCIIAEDFSFVKGEFRSLLLRNFLRLFH